MDIQKIITFLICGLDRSFIKGQNFFATINSVFRIRPNPYLLGLWDPDPNFRVTDPGSGAERNIHGSTTLQKLRNPYIKFWEENGSNGSGVVMVIRSSRVWMRSSRVDRGSGCHCQSRNSPGLGPSIFRHSGIWRAADEAVLNIVHNFFFLIQLITERIRYFTFRH